MSAIARLIDAAPRYAQLLRSQYWSRELLHDYQEERLRRTLAIAAKIPFYAQRFGGTVHIDDLRQLPILRRSEIDSLNRSARSRYPPQAQFAQAQSSGTSGVSAEFIFDRSHQRGRHAARARYLRANGWNPIERSAWLASGAFLNSTLQTDTDLQFISRLFLGVRFLANSIPLPDLADQIARLNPAFVYLFPSILDGLVRTFESTGAKLPALRRVFCGAEVLEPSLRERTRDQLGVPIFDNYWSTEAFLAWQCPVGSYHLNAEHVLVELLDETGREARPGQLGRVFITTLENHLMPLVRYDIGDYAIAADGVCSCGRTLPLIGPIAGRGMNLFWTAEKKLITTWDLVKVLKHFHDIGTFQIVQKSLQRILLRYVAERPIDGDAQTHVRSGFAAFIGPGVAIEFERLTEIPRTPSGKFMLTVSEVEP